MKTTLMAETKAAEEAKRTSHLDDNEATKVKEKEATARLRGKTTLLEKNNNDPSPSFPKVDGDDGFNVVGKGKLTTHPLKKAIQAPKQPPYISETRGSGRGQNYGYRGGTNKGIGRGPGPYR
ncbi:unnamed protein product [Cuscuta campestris]|uniref:Uncharacterized protein n=1 Tax=Cuscuta campestris TaxID=132261 RepID=A0A484LF48_9ASTE|nr:unnamed protein product [Cuscuta campestris]